ncbi:MAG: TonB-dependent receptor, partial [Gammaproteobacteria bacterium]
MKPNVFKAALAGFIGAQGLGAAFAQTDAPGASKGIEEIVVTAQRREESLQDVPVAVTALSSDDIENLQVTDVAALQNAAPNMVVSKFPGDNSSANIGIRGFFSAENLITIDNPVGLYIDGVYVARSAGGNLDMLDIGRIEVLRGPQGTLFGRNTIGGAVNLVPNRPRDEFELGIKAGLGDFDLYEAEGVLNLPVGEAVAMRLAARHGSRDGYASSGLTGRPLNSAEADFARLQLAAEPFVGWDLLVSGDYSRSSNEGQWVTLLSYDPAGLAELDVRVAGAGDSLANYVDRYSTTPPSNADGKFEVRVWGASAVL